MPNVDSLIILGNKYPVVTVSWTRRKVIIFLRRKRFFLLILFPLVNFLSKSYHSPIRNFLFPVTKVKILAYLYLHNSFWELENVKQ